MSKGPATALDLGELEELVLGLGAPRFHARQIASWIHRRQVSSWEAMTDLSVDLRRRLGAHLPVTSGSQVVGVTGADDETLKVAVQLTDGCRIETVVLREEHRTSACVSTQVGCAVGCRFCRSGQQGLRRNLTRAEIVEQLHHVATLLRAGEHLGGVVLMGIGEPLDAYPAVLGSLRTLCAPWGLDLAPRRITLSTVGRPERIRQLAEEGPGVHLAISLHAGRQETRDLLIPRNRCPATLEEIVTAGRDYATRTGRDVTFEYVLVAGINDTRAEAEALARLLGGRHLILNLIPANPVAGTEVRPPSQQVIHRFRNIVQEGGLVVTIRKRRGRQVEAACGQLLPRGPART